jgi:hypothetical protein
VVIFLDKAAEEGISILMRGEQPMRNAPFRLTADGFGDTPVEAFDETICLRPEWPREPVLDIGFGAGRVEGIVARGFVLGLSLLVDGEASVNSEPLSVSMVRTLCGNCARKRFRNAAAVAPSRRAWIST